MRTYRLTTVTETGERFRDFAPVVASIDDRGAVAFWAALADGGEGIFVAEPGADAVAVASTAAGDFSAFTSHPDIDAGGAVSVYATRSDGRDGVYLVRDGRAAALADTGGRLAHVGPLGPTMNDRGDVAFRGTTDAGAEGVFACRDGIVETIAVTGDEYAGFDGLPVITGDRAVVFRADLRGRGPAIHRWRDGRVSAVADTTDRFADLGRFPVARDDGTVAFTATLRDGGEGVFTVRDGAFTTVVDTAGPFESFRGVLLDRAGVAVFYGTPAGREIGIFTGPDPSANGVLSIGTPLLGSTVSLFVLNPVSVNQTGQLALRIELADSRQAILRADPIR